MYKKETNKGVSIAWKYATVVLSVMIIALGTYTFVLRGNLDSNSAESTQNSERATNQNSAIAVLGQTQTIAQTEGATPNDVMTASLSLPDGWISSDTETRPDLCGGNSPMQVSLHSKDSITVTMYELSSAENCKPLSIEDVTLNFNYNNNGTLQIPTDSINFCSKDQNPDCPKGDGKVSVYIQGINTETNQHQSNPKTGKSYVFSVIDSTVSGDNEGQIRNLASIVESAFTLQ